MKLAKSTGQSPNLTHPHVHLAEAGLAPVGSSQASPPRLKLGGTSMAMAGVFQIDVCRWLEVHEIFLVSLEII